MYKKIPFRTKYLIIVLHIQLTMYIYLKFRLSSKKQKRDHIWMHKERCARIEFGMIKFLIFSLFSRHLGLEHAIQSLSCSMNFVKDKIITLSWNSQGSHRFCFLPVSTSGNGICLRELFHLACSDPRCRNLNRFFRELFPQKYSPRTSLCGRASNCLSMECWSHAII